MVKHRAIKITSEPTAGSILERLSLKQGDIVRKINNKSCKNIENFTNSMQELSGNVKLEITNSNGTAATININLD